MNDTAYEIVVRSIDTSTGRSTKELVVVTPKDYDHLKVGDTFFFEEYD